MSELQSISLKNMASQNNTTTNHQQHENENLIENNNNADHDVMNHHHQNTNLSANVRISATVAPSGIDLCGCHISSRMGYIIGSSVIFFGGLIWGLVANLPLKDSNFGKVFSAMCGGWYFLAWSISFFPQIYINYRRKSVIGQSFDYLFLNLLGFCCYLVYNLMFYFSDEIKAEYADRFGSKNEVQINDVGFSLMAAILTIYNVYQVFIYERGDQVLSAGVFYAMMISIAVGLVWCLILCFGVRTHVFFNPLDLLYGISLFKLAISVYKYIPQIYLNYKRQTTTGWNIMNVQLDFTGGFLSVLQEILDAAMNDTWVALAGNAVKFGLGSFSVIYDIIMLIQHYVLYAENNRKLLEQYKREGGHVEDGDEKQENDREDV